MRVLGRLFVHVLQAVNCHGEGHTAKTCARLVPETINRAHGNLALFAVLGLCVS